MAGRILIVDNVPINRIILKVKLASAYYEVLQATSGADAITHAAKCQPEIIILDTDLGDMDAHEACMRLKQNPATRHIPVLIATPTGDAEAKIAALKAGADEFLSKPIHELTLIARVRALMRTRAMTDELHRRDETAQAVGLTRTQSSFAKLGRITLVGKTTEEALTWRVGLKGLVPDHVKTLPAERFLETIAAEEASDIYVMSCDIATSSDGLQLVSDLRARPHTRTASIIMVHDEHARKEAIMALDLGANDIITRGADPEEMALRLNSQMRRKHEEDVLRMSLDANLRLAMIDPLTGLHNRRYAFPQLAQIAQTSALSGQSYAIMLVDLDKFKSINDTYGHAIGDEVLKEVAHRLKATVRDVDMVARIGGEEFLIAMPMTTLEEARSVAERLRKSICQTPAAKASCGRIINVSTSIGLAIGTGSKAAEAPSVDTLLFAADRALYDAKAEGRNQVTLGYAA